MPNYDYYCTRCETTVELNVPIEERLSQRCKECSGAMIRKITFKGAVWSPTRNGGHS